MKRSINLRFCHNKDNEQKREVDATPRNIQLLTNKRCTKTVKEELTYLAISNKITDRNIGIFSLASDLDLRNNNVTNSGIQKLTLAWKSGGVRLRHLNANGLNISDVALCTLLSCCDQLESLDIAFNNVTDNCLKIIGTHCTKLHTLNLSGCCGITTLGLQYLSSLPNLRELRLAQCSTMIGNGLHHLSSLKLEELDLSSCNFTCDALKMLPSYLPKINKLNLSHCRHVTDEVVQSVATQCLRLEELILANTPSITDRMLKFLLFYTSSITNLDLQHNQPFDVHLINALICKGMHVKGGSIEIVVYSREAEPIVLIEDKFTPLIMVKNKLIRIINNNNEKGNLIQTSKQQQVCFRRVKRVKKGKALPSVPLVKRHLCNVLSSVLSARDKNRLYLETQ